MFVTIATSPRRALFGEIVGGEVRLSPLGLLPERSSAIEAFAPSKSAEATTRLISDAAPALTSTPRLSR